MRRSTLPERPVAVTRKKDEATVMREAMDGSRPSMREKRSYALLNGSG